MTTIKTITIKGTRYRVELRDDRTTVYGGGLPKWGACVSEVLDPDAADFRDRVASIAADCLKNQAEASARFQQYLKENKVV